MEFCNYSDLYSDARDQGLKVSRDELYLHALSDPQKLRPGNHIKFLSESMWNKARRPYYNLWPAVVPMVANLDLERVPTVMLSLPEPTICVRLRKNLSGCPHPIEEKFSSLLVSMTNEVRNKCNMKNLSIIGQDRDSGKQFLIAVALDKDQTVYQAFMESRTRSGASGAIEKSLGLMNIITTICLLSSGSELMQPVVLNKDREKYLATLDGKYIEKAKRRGQYGWDIGREIEMTPHFRRPHPALVWTGKGRIVPKIILRKGCIVHRDKTSDVPTGYLDKMESAKAEN